METLVPEDASKSQDEVEDKDAEEVRRAEKLLYLRYKNECGNPTEIASSKCVHET